MDPQNHNQQNPNPQVPPTQTVSPQPQMYNQQPMQQAYPQPMQPQHQKMHPMQKAVIAGFAVLIVIAIGVAVVLLVRGRSSQSTSRTTVGNVFDSQNAKARNVMRETDIKSIHAQIEAYWAQNGYYPSLANLNDTSFRATYLKGLDNEAFKDPSSTSYTLVSSPTANAYSYEVMPSNCDNLKTQCATYTLTATYEGTNNGLSTYVKHSLN